MSLTFECFKLLHSVKMCTKNRKLLGVVNFVNPKSRWTIQKGIQLEYHRLNVYVRNGWGKLNMLIPKVVYDFMEHVMKELSPAVTTEQSLVKNTGTTQLVKPCISMKQILFIHQPTSTVAEFILPEIQYHSSDL